MWLALMASVADGALCSELNCEACKRAGSEKGVRRRSAMCTCMERADSQGDTCRSEPIACLITGTNMLNASHFVQHTSDASLITLLRSVPAFLGAVFRCARFICRNAFLACGVSAGMSTAFVCGGRGPQGMVTILFDGCCPCSTSVCTGCSASTAAGPPALVHFKAALACTL